MLDYCILIIMATTFRILKERTRKGHSPLGARSLATIVFGIQCGLLGALVGNILCERRIHKAALVCTDFTLNVFARARSETRRHGQDAYGSRACLVEQSLLQMGQSLARTR